MAAYWISFRLADDRDYTQRYEALMEAIRQLSTKWWTEPTAFIVFESASKIDAVATAVKQVIDEAVDIVLIGMPEYKDARAIGAIQDGDIFTLMPFTKKA